MNGQERLALAVAVAAGLIAVVEVATGMWVAAAGATCTVLAMTFLLVGGRRARARQDG